MKQIVLKYKQVSTDSFTVSLTADVLSCRVYTLPNMETKDSEFRRSSGKRCSIKTPRLYADIVISPTMFETSDTNWINVQKWYNAPIMQFEYITTSQYQTLDGITSLSANNTIYWNIADVNPVFEQADQPERKLRYLEINLESMDKYQL